MRDRGPRWEPGVGVVQEIGSRRLRSTSPLEAYRGPTLALHVRSIGEAAKLEVGGSGFVRAREARPAPYSDYSAFQGAGPQKLQVTSPSSVAA